MGTTQVGAHQTRRNLPVDNWHAHAVEDVGREHLRPEVGQVGRTINLHGQQAFQVAHYMLQVVEARWKRLWVAMRSLLGSHAQMGAFWVAIRGSGFSGW